MGPIGGRISSNNSSNEVININIIISINISIIISIITGITTGTGIAINTGEINTPGPGAVTAIPPSRSQDLRGGRRLHPALVSKWIMLDLEHANFSHTHTHTHTTTRRSCLLGFSIELATYKT